MFCSYQVFIDIIQQQDLMGGKFTLEQKIIDKIYYVIQLSNAKSIFKFNVYA